MTIRDHSLEAKNLLLDLLRFDTQNSDINANLRGITLPLLSYVKERLSEKNIPSEIQTYELQRGEEKICDRGNLIARIGNPPYILLQGHVDTVPYSIPKWSRDPLGEFVSGEVYGRGAVDMKGPVTGLILALEELAERESDEGMMLLLTSDEEANSFAGIKHYLSRNEDEINFGICAESTNFQIANSFKGAMYYIISVTGKSAHGSRPEEGISAIKLRHAIENYLLFDFEDFVFAQEVEGLGNSTINVGISNGGTKVNMVPDRAVIEFEMRTVKSVDEYRRALKEIVLDRLDFDFTIKEMFAYNPFQIPTKGVFFERLEKSLSRHGENVEYTSMAGFTEAKFLNDAGIPTIVFGPGDMRLAHTEGTEKISIDDIIRFRKILMGLF